MGAIAVTYPWPHKNLHSNGRGCRAYIARLRKEAREQAAQITWDAGLGPHVDVLPKKVTFLPRTNARQDTHNRPFAVKSMIDGIAECLGVDDSAFDLEWAHGDKITGGAVIVTFEEIPVS